MPAKNERKCCDAVARILEQRASVQRANERTPENEGGRIDYTFDLGELRFAVEHTEVEAFDGQKRADADFEAFMLPVESALQVYATPPGLFRLWVPIDACSGLKARARRRKQEAVIGWGKEAITRLKEKAPPSVTRSEFPNGFACIERDVVEGIPLHLRHEVYWSPMPRLEGRVLAGRFAPDQQQLYSMREARVEKALQSHCPKLHDCKQAGATAVLVLENHVSLSDHAEIAESIFGLVGERTDMPDEVFLVDTCLSGEWYVWSLIRSGVLWPDENTRQRYRTFDPTTLIEV
jgi:hypothetical protein